MPPLHCPINQFPSPVLVCSIVVVWSENSTTLKRCDFFFILNSILAHRTGLYFCLFRDLFFPQDKETICSLPELIKENILDYLLEHERSFSGSCTRERTPVPNPAFKQTQVLCALLPPSAALPRIVMKIPDQATNVFWKSLPVPLSSLVSNRSSEVLVLGLINHFSIKLKTVLFNPVLLSFLILL